MAGLKIISHSAIKTLPALIWLNTKNLERLGRNFKFCCIRVLMGNH